VTNGKREVVFVFFVNQHSVCNSLEINPLLHVRRDKRAEVWEIF